MHAHLLVLSTYPMELSVLSATAGHAHGRWQLLPGWPKRRSSMGAAAHVPSAALLAALQQLLPAYSQATHAATKVQQQFSNR